MSTREYAERMSRALEGSGLAEPRSASFGENRIAVLCRVSKDNESKWIDLITKILIGSDLSTRDAINWQCHICRHYFLKEVNDENKLVWGWNFSIQSREMGLALDMIIGLVKGQPLRVNKNELDEFPLQAPPNRNAVKHGKGVHTIGGSDDFHWGKK